MDQSHYDIFISYSRKDIAIADKICAALDSASITYFIDRKGISGGFEFPKEIANAIINCHIFLLLGSKNAYASKFTNSEITFAFNKKDKNKIIPYLIDKEPLPIELELVFSAINWRNIYDHPIDSVLIPDLCKLLGRKFQRSVANESSNQQNVSPTRVVNPTPIKLVQPRVSPSTQNNGNINPPVTPKSAQKSSTTTYSPKTKPSPKTRIENFEDLYEIIQNRITVLWDKIETYFWILISSLVGLVFLYLIVSNIYYIPSVTKFCAERGWATAQYDLAENYYADSLYTDAIEWYIKAAEQNNAKAQYSLGELYYNGNGVKQDYAEAVKWYRKAAEQDYAEAQNMLGSCYYNGKGLDQDYAEAVNWYRKAAEQGYACAQYNLGRCYFKSNGVKQDYAEAVKWFLKAAEQDYAMAQNNLGECYCNGNGVKQDYVEAVKWYRKAGEQEYARSQYNLGVCYYYGKGVQQDYAEAVKWYRKAAEQGDFSAQYCLGECYYSGNGVDKNLSLAKSWYQKSAAQGFEAAKLRLKEIG